MSWLVEEAFVLGNLVLFESVRVFFSTVKFIEDCRRLKKMQVRIF